MIPPPTPVPQNTPRIESYGLPAPSRNSASVATCTSLPTLTGVPSCFESSSARGNVPSQSGRLRAVDTEPVAGSITPGEPTPTPCSSDGSTPAPFAASVTASDICSATPAGPPVVGVGRRDAPRTLWRGAATRRPLLLSPPP